MATAAAAAAPAAPKPLYRPPSSHNLSRSNSATDLGRVPSNSNLDVEDRVKGVASHPWHDLPVGGNAPEMFTCVIEIPQVGPGRAGLWGTFVGAGLPPHAGTMPVTALVTSLDDSTATA